MSRAHVVAKHRLSCASVGRTAKKRKKRVLLIKQRRDKSVFFFFLPHRHTEGAK